uniref:Uncharacterized protein n=1 Tax=Romanomermis culicivorax TaxID=13658 RepID=A0A915J2P6_ROMCU
MQEQIKDYPKNNTDFFGGTECNRTKGKSSFRAIRLKVTVSRFPQVMLSDRKCIFRLDGSSLLTICCVPSENA